MQKCLGDGYHERQLLRQTTLLAQTVNDYYFNMYTGLLSSGTSTIPDSNNWTQVQFSRSEQTTKSSSGLFGLSPKTTTTDTEGTNSIRAGRISSRSVRLGCGGLY